jgi:hypothetical protein
MTGFHPLDGARYLRDCHGAGLPLCNLVAYHTAAIVEAEERGLDTELAREFSPERASIADALTYCDMLTGPDGRPLTINERLLEILARYGERHLVGRSIRRATPLLVAAVEATAARVEEAG